MVAPHKRVLVVDDEQIVCESYRRVLTDAGYSVCTARSGRDALTACRTQPFDVILADLKMPDMGGLEVVRAVTQEFPHVQVLVITGYPTPQSAAEARRLGVFDYLHKPVTPDRLNVVTAAAFKSLPVSRPVPTKPSVKAVSEETARPMPQPDKLVESEIRTDSETSSASVLKMLSILAAVPLIGLAYILFLPFIGFGILFGVIGMSLWEKLGWVRKSSAVKK